jgi:L-rhamnonate dehydratase
LPVRVSLGITVAKKIADMCEANEVLVIPHAGQMHNYHVTVSKVPVEVFWYISTAGRSPDGFIDLSDTAPGFGLTLKPVDANFKLTR